MKTKKGDECSLWHVPQEGEPIFYVGKIKTLDPLVVTATQFQDGGVMKECPPVDFENKNDNGIYWKQLD